MAIEDKDGNGNNELRYRVLTYFDTGKMNSFDIWIRPYDGASWQIVALEKTGSRTVDVIDGNIFTEMVVIAEPGQRTYTSFYSPEFLRTTQDHPYRPQIVQMDYMDAGETVFIVACYDFERETQFVRSVTLYHIALPMIQHGLSEEGIPAFSEGMPKERVKSLLGSSPYYEDEHTLIYPRILYPPIVHAKVVRNPMWGRPGFETLRFVDGGLHSIEISVGTDYQITTTELRGNFVSEQASWRKEDHDTANRALFHTICGYKTYTIENRSECICIHPPDHMEKGFAYFRAGKNMRFMYQGISRFDSDFVSTAFDRYASGREKTLLDARDFAFASMAANDYDGDGLDEVLALAIFPETAFPVMYDNNRRFTFFQLTEDMIDTICAESGNDRLREDIGKLTVR